MQDSKKIPVSSIEKSYKGFDLIEKKEIPDSSSLSLYFRHRKTGLEVLHLLNNDSENLFSFGFRTPPSKSNGAAHVIEHSVLCGSERYPLKDPFIHLDNQSINTYLNAVTFPDKTLYPGSSVSEKDYFNLMSVYGDAVFFPRLEKEIFMQEGHHLEISEDGDFTMQGVVFNEMKGNYSDYDSVAGDLIDAELLKGSIYALDSGGDPLEVAEMTYDEFRNFHKTYYRPDNCLVFLYGNIPTEKQLDFLQDNFIDRLEKREGFVPDFREKYLPGILENEHVKPWTEMREIRAKAPLPAGGYEGNTAGLAWFIANKTDIYSKVESLFFSSVLVGHNGTSFVKALIDSPLGKDIDSVSGGNSAFLPFTYVVALRGVEPGNEEKVKDFIYAALQKKYEEGFTEDEIEGAVNNFVISNKEIARGHGGPFSLHYMRSVYTSWCYDCNPTELLFKNQAFEKLIQNVKNDPDYLKNYLKKTFLDNKSAAFVIIEPSEDFLSEREKKEKEIIDSIVKVTDKEKIISDVDALHKFQERKEDLSCLPHFGREDLDGSPVEIPELDVYELENKCPLYVTKTQTNGIVYFEIGFPIDVFKPEMYPYLCVFNYIANDMGWEGVSWDESSTIINKVTGSFSTAKVYESIAKDMDYTEVKKICGPAFHRVWHVYKAKFLAEKTDDVLSIMEKLILKLSLDDKQHFEYLLQELLNDTESTILPYGHIYASTRAESLSSRDTLLEECWNGLSGIFDLRRMASDIDGTMEKMKEIARTIFTNGAYIHVTLEDGILPEMKEKLLVLSKKLGLKEPAPALEVSLEELKKLITVKDSDPKSDEAFLLPCQVGYACVVFNSSPYNSRESVADAILAHILSGTLLWEQLRTVGGSYGASATNNALDSNFTIVTYRDPDPENSLELIDKCLEIASKKGISDDEFEKAVISAYGTLLTPITPSVMGIKSRNQLLYGLTRENRQKRLEILLSLTKEDIEQAAKRLYESRKAKARTVLVTSKLNKLAGKIQKINI